MSDVRALESGSVRVAVSATDGGLVALGNDALGIQLVSEHRLAESWRLLVHLPGGITTIRGVDQPAPRIEVIENGLSLAWDVLDTLDGEVPIAVRQELRLDEDTLTAQLVVDNQSGLMLEESYPLCIGGMANWAEQDAWRMLVPGLIWGGEEWDFYREFRGSYLGYRRSTFAFAYPGASVDYWQKNLSMAWASLYHPDRGVGVYFGNHNPEIAFSAFWGELVPQPDFASPKGRTHLLWPHPSRVDGDVAIGATIGWAFFPLLDDGAYTSPPVVVHFHEGGWHEGAAYYRAWFDRAVTPIGRPSRSGLAAHDAWQNTYLEAPGARIRYRFDDLPTIASDALDAGIDVVMIGGYHEGGLDTSYPRFATPSSRLGSQADLEAGIRACRELGVQVLLFANANQISVDAPDYDDHLVRFANLRPDGLPHLPLGFGFDRLLGFMGVTVPRMVSANLAHPEFRELLIGEWDKVISYGPTGIQIDKLICGEPYNLDFNPEVDGHPMSSSHRSLVAAVADFHSMMAMRDPSPWIALETAWDRLLPYGQVTYCRFFGQDHVPVQEVTFPEIKATCCVCGQFDHGLVNNCVRYGHVLALEGDYLWGTSADVPAIVPYIREVLALRRRLFDNLWWATIVEPRFASISSDEGLRVGAFESWEEEPASGTRHALVLHHFEAEAMRVHVELSSPYECAEVHRPFTDPIKVAAPVELDVARDEVVVLLPLPGKGGQGGDA